MDKQGLDRTTEQIIGAAIQVHRTLGPGLLESAYETCLLYELTQRRLKAQQQVPLPVVYGRVRLDCGYRLDLVVESAVIVEIKSVEKIAPIHEAQLLSYLRLAGLNVGLLLNFNCRVLRDGIRRIVNDYPDSALSAGSAVK